MKRSSLNSLRGVVWILVALLLAAEGWWLQRTQHMARSALAALDERRQECTRLARQSPAVTEETERAIERDLADAESALATRRAAWSSRDGTELAGAASPKSIDAYFEIAAFVEKARALAAQAQVKIKADECFGFASHLHQGPAAELAPAVSRQRLMLQTLVETLLAAQPQALLAVQRERPLTAAQRIQHRQPGRSLPHETRAVGGSDQPGDYFAFDERVSLRAPGRIDSDAYRLEFSGQTLALRTFLNRLASGNWPVIVRSVESEPLEARETVRAPGHMAATGDPMPVVTRNISRFAVVVEFVELVADAEKPAP